MKYELIFKGNASYYYLYTDACLAARRLAKRFKVTMKVTCLETGESATFSPND